MGALSKIVGSGLKETAAKRGSKFMGMVEEVQPLRLGKAIDEGKGKGKAALALGAGAAAVGGAAALSGGKEKEAEASGRKVSGTVREANAEERKELDTISKKQAEQQRPSSMRSTGSSEFGKAFKDARLAGLKTFEYEGKKFTTRLAEESAEDHSAAIAKIKEKNDAAYEKKIQELSSQKMAKGGLSTKQQAKVGKVMGEFKDKSLHSGKGGKVVKNPKQAIAIALSEAKRMKKK